MRKVGKRKKKFKVVKVQGRGGGGQKDKHWAKKVRRYKIKWSLNKATTS